MAEALDGALTPDIEVLARQVLETACGREKMLVTAESCTGGLLASLLTDLPGISHAFERGFVTYTDDAKHEMLGVPKAILETDGAVSEAAARAMAEGAIANSRGDVAVSITGFAGAGNGPDQPAGLVHFASAVRDGETYHLQRTFGDVGRAEVRMRCLATSLELMMARLKA